VRQLKLVVGVSIVGFALPYVARLPGCVTKGWGWLLQYLDSGLLGALFLGGFNLVAVATAVGATLLLHRC